jgi:hypothetical protein
MFLRLVVILFLFSPLVGFAQTATIRGVITNPDGVAIEGLLVTEKENPNNGTATNAVGRFTLIIPSGKDVVLIFKGIGSDPVERSIRLNNNEVREVQFHYDNTVSTSIVEIYGDRTSGMRTIDTKLPTKLPTINPGIESYLLQAPVNFASELSSSYSVRGGSFDENLIYVNDIQVYRPFLVRAGEQEGLSFPNPDMVSDIKFSAGGFQAKYGDKMSSVLDIKYAKPDTLQGSVMLGLLGGSLQLGGASKNKKFTHNSGFRYKDNSYVFNTLDVQGDYHPRYYDLQTYLTFSPKEYGPLEFSFLGNYQNNRYQFTPSSRQTDMGNINEALRLSVYFDGQEITKFQTFFGAFQTRYNPSPSSQLNFTVSAFNTYETEEFDIQGAYRLDELERDLGSDNFGDVLRNRGIGGYLDHARNSLDATVLSFSHKGYVHHEGKRNTLSWGVDFQNEHIYDKLSEWSLMDSAGYASPRPPDDIHNDSIPPSQRPNQGIFIHDRIKAINDIRSNRMTAFIQDEKTWEFRDESELTLNAGVRANYWTFNEQLVAGPRISAAYVPSWKVGRLNEQTGQIDSVRKDIVLRAAFGYYYQPPFYREMRGFNGAVNPEIRAQKSIHYILGADYVFHAWERPFKLTTELYYKQLRDLIPYEVENVRLRYFATNNSKGYATGADVMLNGEFIKGVQSWVRASFLKTMEDLVDDFYYLYLNSDGDTIYRGFTINDVVTDSIRVTPGFIPRPNDQRFSFSLLFQDEMPRKPWYKVLITFYFATGLPYGPPSHERYLDVSRTRSYLRTDIGFSRDLILPQNAGKNWFNRTFKQGTIALEVFNLLGTNNIINHQWIEDIHNRQYAVPTYLTGRRLNVRFALKF